MFRHILSHRPRELRSGSIFLGQHVRCKSSLSTSTNPFDVMGIPRDSCADVVRTAFLQLAMRYHPDTSGKDTGDQFQRIREAFERITKSGGKENKARTWLTEEVFNSWFEEHTGLRMDAATRREVMLAYRHGACQNAHSRTRYLPPAWQIAFILEEHKFSLHSTSWFMSLSFFLTVLGMVGLPKSLNADNLCSPLNKT